MATPNPPKASKPAVTLRQGAYVGSTILATSYFPRPVDAFRGIPYAQTTAGQNRFRPPQPLPASSQTFDALRFGKACPKEGRIAPDTGEDCLNLNVYRTGPGLEGTLRTAKLPVIIYVHGGGFNAGCGIERNMAAFVSWADDDMIGINFNYRVGALGFLPSALTAKEELLNLGLRDQQLLFEWVQENIEAFGGDPDNVTIMGLSAGAHSIGHHLMYYARAPKGAPFAKAILESGATTARAVLIPTHPRHLIQFEEFLAAAGLGSVPEAEVFTRLRELPLQTIVSASKAVWDRYIESVTWPFQPVIDAANTTGSHSAPSSLLNSTSPSSNFSTSTHHPPPPALIPDLPIHSWRQGKHLRIPVLTGYNTNEGTIFIPGGADTNADFRAFFTGLIPSFSAADLDALEKLYPDPVTDPNPQANPYRDVPSGKGRQWARLDAAYSHYAYICPVLQTAHFLSTDIENQHSVHVYRYAATAQWGTANHGDEAPVVAHDVASLGGGRLPGLLAVADAMHGAWARFVVSKAGDPNPPSPEKSDDGVVAWPTFLSPFSPSADGVVREWTGTVRRGETPAGETGQLLVFGEGNDERVATLRAGQEGVSGVGGGGWKEWFASLVGAGKTGLREGTPAKVGMLSEVELAACRFWWGRVELSEGLGNRGIERERAKL